MQRRLGWRWFAWICTIVTALNLAAVFLFVPETRFKRLGTASLVNRQAVDRNTSDHEKDAPVHLETADHAGDMIAPREDRQPWFEALGIWLGSDSDEAFLKLLLRPLLLVAYPAVLCGILSCEPQISELAIS